MGLNFGSVRSLASMVSMFAGSDPVKAQLIPLDDYGNEMSDLQRAFQYFPNEINDSKGATYATKNIPGGSHPLYQFISGGDRTISFTAVFTSDEDPAPPDILGALQGGLEIGMGTLGSLFSGEGFGALKKSGATQHNVPVESAVIWLRSFLYPRYTKETGQKLETVAPPRVVRLYLPNSGIHGATRGKNPQLVVDSIDCLMMQCDVVYDCFYRNGAQRITTVNLTFNETVQTGAKNWGFADGGAFTRAWLKGKSTGGSKIVPYNNKVKGRQADKDSIQSGLSDEVNSYASKVGDSVSKIKLG